MINEKLKFKHGDFKLTIEKFHFDMTYSGLKLTEETDEFIMKFVNETLTYSFGYPSGWGKKKSFLKKDNQYESHNVLHPCYYSVWLICDEGVNDPNQDYDGSEVILNWFGKPFWENNFKDVIIGGLNGFDWENNAENFIF